MPTAVFYVAEGKDLHTLPKLYGRAAVAAYVDGTDGRLMRSMKSVLGSALMEQHTDIGAGRSVAFGDVIASYLLHLKRAATAHAGREVERVVLGRPVFFVDDDPARDAAAQASLEAAARAVGFTDVRFQYEPIAAAFHYEEQVTREQTAIVADIGGGTSDFSVVRVGPARRDRPDRRDDILASHGVHIAGTDFDRRVELDRILPALGYGAYGPKRGDRAPLEVPSRIYFDLATWHLINTVYRPQRVMEIAAMRDDYANPPPVHELSKRHIVDNVVGLTFFSGISGSALADAAGPGSMMIRMMDKAGYDRSYAAALTAATAIVGPIIPPSIIMIIYALQDDNVSVGALFVAGLLPGILIAVAMCVVNFHVSKKRNYRGDGGMPLASSSERSPFARTRIGGQCAALT